MGAERQGAEKALDLLQGTTRRDLLVRFAFEISSVREMAHRGSKKSTASITSQLCSVASQWQLETSQGRMIYTTEMGILVLFREVVVDINQHVTGTIPLAPEREWTCGEREREAWKGGKGRHLVSEQDKDAGTWSARS